MTINPNVLFQPAEIGSLQLKNRVVMPAMETNLCSADGAVTREQIAYYGRRAGGVGLVIVEYTCVDAPSGLGAPTGLRLDHDRYIIGHARLVEAIHRADSRAALQLYHAGRQTRTVWTGTEPVAPSPIPCKLMKDPPRVLSAPEIETIEEQFVSAIRRAQQAGYDAVELHAAHGYLLNQFLSPYTNRRTDQYGGTVVNRVRILENIIRQVRTRNMSLPITVRISADEFVPGGIDIAEAIAIARELQRIGVHAIHVSTGIHETMERNVDPMDVSEGWRIPYASRIREQVRIPVIAVGVIRDPRMAEAIIQDGHADFVAIGRGLIADPDWAVKAQHQEFSGIRRCISCNVCADWYQPIRCTVNPEVGHELDTSGIVGSPAKQVVIIGAGPAGMEMARVAHNRGHQVTIYEALSEPVSGGQFALSMVAPGKEKVRWLQDFYKHVLQQSAITFRPNTRVTPEFLQNCRGDVCVIAVGSEPRMIPASVVDRWPNAWSAQTVLTDPGHIGPPPRKVTILGGHATACETALFLRSLGYSVRVAFRGTLKSLAEDETFVNRRSLVSRMRSLGIVLVDQVELALVDRCTAVIEAEGVVVVAWGVQPNQAADRLAHAAQKNFAQVLRVGDADQPGNFLSAVHAAYWQASAL